MTDRKQAVFVSYASEDAAQAARITDALREAGVEVWFDQSALKSGDAWDQMIRRQIRDCALLIAVISAHTNARTEGYFRREWKLAVDRTDDLADDAPFLLPVLIDETAQASARVPEKFRQMQWTRMPGGEASRAFVDRVRALLAADGAGVPGASGHVTTASAPGKTAAPRSRAFRGWAWSVPVLVAIAAVAVSVYRPTPAPPEPPPAAAALTTASVRSVAVLPYLDLSPLKDQGFFAQGMAGEIIDRLAKIPKIKVTSRDAAFQFKPGSGDSRQIGEKLNVAYVVEGSVVKIGDRIRVTSQLIESVSGVRLWTDSEDRDYADVLKIQQQIATGIARALQLIVTAEDERRSRSLNNPEAYTEYLKGLNALDRFHQASLFEAQGSFEHALALEPTFIEAAEALGKTHVALALDESMSPRLAWEAARKAATAALSIDSNSATAHAVLAIVSGFADFNWSEADREIAVAIALQPRDANTLNYAARIAHAEARKDESLRLINAAISINPLDPYAHLALGQMLYTSGDLDGAELPYHHSLEISPVFDGSHLYLAIIQLLRGNPGAARAEVSAEPAENARNAGRSMELFAQGRKGESDAAVARLILSSSDRWPFGIVQVYAFRHDREQTFRWLERSFEQRDPDLTMNARGDPLLAFLQADPRYRELLQKMHMSP